jgi:undecaprenyl-diphosphatase
MSHLTYPESMVIGLIQGVTELFPVSSLGHAVLIPALIGGSWAQDLNMTAPGSGYLAFIVGLHVATALAMIIYFWRDWLRIVGGLLTSLRDRRMTTADQRLAWLIIVATIPVGIAGVALEHLFRVLFSKPILAAVFLSVNGVILLAGERLRRRAPADDVAPSRVAAGEPALAGAAGSWPAPPSAPQPGPQIAARREADRTGPDRTGPADPAVLADRRLAATGMARAVLIGSTQILALLPGISRDGIVTVTGMFRGLSREDAVRFSFLLSAPVILAAGALKFSYLAGPAGSGIRAQVLAGSLVAGVAAYLSVRFLVRYFSKSRTLTPFAIYCLVAGLGSLCYLVLR